MVSKKTNGLSVVDCCILADGDVLNFQTAPLPWKIYSSIAIQYILSECHAFTLQGTEGALGPIGIIGPSGHPVCTFYLILSAKLYVTSLWFLAMMEWSSVSFLSTRDPRVTKEVGGRRCVALLWWILFSLYCEHRLAHLVWRRRAILPPFALSTFHFLLRAAVCCDTRRGT